MKPSAPEPSPNAKRPFRWGLFVWAVLGVVLGTIPFLLGAAAQAVYRRPIPAYLCGLVNAILYLALWRLTGFLPIRVGEGQPLWPSVVLSLVLFVAFFAGGAALCRDFKHPRTSIK